MAKINEVSKHLPIIPKNKPLKTAAKRFFIRVKMTVGNRRVGKILKNQVQDFACALLAKGLTSGASVAILAGNIPEWTIVDIATIAAGGVGVGIYPTSSPEQCEYIINHSDAEFVFVDSVGTV